MIIMRKSRSVLCVGLLLSGADGTCGGWMLRAFLLPPPSGLGLSWAGGGALDKRSLYWTSSSARYSFSAPLTLNLLSLLFARYGSVGRGAGMFLALDVWRPPAASPRR